MGSKGVNGSGSRRSSARDPRAVGDDAFLPRAESSFLTVQAQHVASFDHDHPLVERLDPMMAVVGCDRTSQAENRSLLPPSRHQPM